MKNLSFSGVKNTLFVMAILALTTLSCSKADTTPPPTGGGGGGGGTPAAPVITLPIAPTTPLWFGGSYSGSYSVSNAPSGSLFYIDEVPSALSGTVSLTNLQASKSIRFELRKSDGTAVLSSKTLEIPVYTSDQSTIERYGDWIQYRQQEDTTVGLTGAYYDVGVPICDVDDRYNFVNKIVGGPGDCFWNTGANTCGSLGGRLAFDFHTVNGVKKLERGNSDPLTWFKVWELSPTYLTISRNVLDLWRGRYINVKYYYQH